MAFIFILTIPNWERKVRNTNLGNGLKALSPYFHASLTQRLLRITKKQSEDSPSPSINLRNFVLAQRKRQEDAKNSTMPTPNFNIWVNYNKNHINLKLVIFLWRILLNDLFGYRMFA